MFKNFTIRIKLLIGSITMAVIVSVVGYVGYTELGVMKASQDMFVEEKIPGIVNLQIIDEAQVAIKAQQFGLVTRRLTDLNERKVFFDIIEEKFIVANNCMTVYKSLKHDSVQKELFEKLIPLWNSWRESVNVFVGLAKQKNQLLAKGVDKDSPEMKKIDDDQFEALQISRKLFTPAEDCMGKLINDLKDDIKKSDVDADKSAASAFTLLITFIIIGIVLALFIGLFISANIVKIIKSIITETQKLVESAVNGKLDTRGNAEKINFEFRGIVVGINNTLDAVIGPLNVAAEYIDRISKGDIPPKITEKYNGDFNEIKNNINQCIDAVDLLVSDAKMLAKAAIDGKLDTRANAMRHGGDFRAIVQGVNETLDNVIGPLNVAAEYVDRIAKGDIPPKITEKYNGDFNEIKNNLNQCIDAVDLLVTDAKMLAKAAEEGKLDTRANAMKHGGDFRAIVEGVNKTLDNVIGPLNIAAEYVDRISKGDIPPKITDKYNGDFNEIKNNLNGCIDSVNLLVSEAAILAKAAADGKLDTRADAAKHGGDFRKIVQGVNNTLDNVIGPLNIAAEYVNRISKGDIPPKITDKYNGDFNEIKNNLNGCIDAVNLLVADAAMLAKAAEEGKLDTRADATKHGGDFRKIVRGVNNTLNNVIGPLNVAAEYVDRISKGDIPSKITDKYEGDFNEIKNNLNQCIDSVNLLVSDAAMLAKAASEGRLATRADAAKHGGDFRAIVVGVNKTLDDVIGPLNVAADYVEKISKGNIPNKITKEYFGDFNILKNNLNVCIDAVNLLVTDAAMLAKAAEEGKLDTRANAMRHGGDFKAIVDGVNKTLDNVIGPLNVAAEYVDKISKGDIPQKITDNYHGDFNAIKNNLNLLIEAMNSITNASEQISAGNLNISIKERSGSDKLIQSLNIMINNIKFLVNDSKMLANAAAEGKLTTRADASKHGGDFSVIVSLINQMMDLIVEPVNESISVLQAIADGDLTVHMTGNYKGEFMNLKTALNDTVTSIHDILSQVKTTVEEVNSGSRQVSDASTALSQGATEQAASLEEITSSMSEIGSQTKMNAENANHANILTNEAKVVADKGTKEMEQLNKAMKEINDSSKNISKIIKVIDEIAFQTNLLALNAAVEAARAGRHGKGFAVVAEEVRNLAARSATAAKETSDMIENSIKTVENGALLANRTSDALTEIKQSSIKAADIVAEIATSSNEQAQAISQINEGLRQIDQVTQTNTASAEESASASEELSGQANNLKQMISRFVLKEERGYSNKMSKENTQRYISTRREASKRLTSQNFQESTQKSVRPDDIINLDEDDFGRY
jgi:methyl-accepting chemotaxis protein